MNELKSMASSSAMSAAMRTLDRSSIYPLFAELATKVSSRNFGPLSLSEAYQVVSHGFEHTSVSSTENQMEALSNQVEDQVAASPRGSLSKEFISV